MQELHISSSNNKNNNNKVCRQQCDRAAAAGVRTVVVGRQWWWSLSLALRDAVRLEVFTQIRVRADRQRLTWVRALA